MSKGRVVCALSGGVDSSVAAYLLKEQGYEVIGMFMKNWHDTSVTISNDCPWVEDSNDALIVADKLDIPFYRIDLSDEYKKDIVDYMIDAYKNGLTPNPDVLCNYHIKFGHFLNHALKVKADFVATGHYAKVDDGKLYKAIDPTKDQSYFLSQVTTDQLKYALFPLGDLTKVEVRKIAKEQDLITADKKDSQGLCFIGKVHLTDFLSQSLAQKEGVCIDVNTGDIVGKHKGAHFYTRGQRKSLGIDGAEKPYYVAKKDVESNILYVSDDKDSDDMNSNSIFLKNINHYDKWDIKYDPHKLTVQYQYHGKFYNIGNILMDANRVMVNNGLIGDFYVPERGQFLVVYEGDRIILSGEIDSYY
jgi:tRNA-specific 2-thiouridylase